MKGRKSMKGVKIGVFAENLAENVKIRAFFDVFWRFSEKDAPAANYDGATIVHDPTTIVHDNARIAFPRGRIVFFPAAGALGAGLVVGRPSPVEHSLFTAHCSHRAGLCLAEFAVVRSGVVLFSPAMHIPSFIERKREGGELGAGEIGEFIAGYARGVVPDYQAAAWAMAVFFKGMSATETGALTRAMRDSGRVLAYPKGSPLKVDKHSTGGIGDKVSLVLAPLLACAGVWVPMISGRGLGITGGTLDKMESIPGFRTGLAEDEALAQLARIGVVMIGQTADLCPADKKLYALRDVTATVPSIPLIVASIMSKKLAESLDRLVLDVKFGSGAFMKTRADAQVLADAMCAVGAECGVETTAILNTMDEPLGHTAGNALEVWESVETLQGRGPADLVALTLDLGEKVSPVPREQLAAWLADGTAWRKWTQLVEAQGGRAADTDRILEIHRAPLIRHVTAEQSGTLARMDAELIGRACVALGAGRAKANDGVDFAVGCAGIAKTGTRVAEGEPLLTLHARDERTLADAMAFVRRAVEVV